MSLSRPSLGSDVAIERTNKITALRIGIIAAIVLAIEFLPRFGVVDELTLIPLSEMLDVMVSMLRTGELTPHLVQTFTAVFSAFALAIACGVPIGILLWRVESLKDVLDPYLLTYYSIPIFAFYPLLITFLGMSILPIVAIAWAFSIVIIITNTASGLDEIPEVYVQTGRDMNLSRYQLFQHVYFPAAAPYVFTGLKLGFIYSLIGTIASEFILADAGLGWLISYSYDNFAVGEMYAAMLLVILLSIVVNVSLIAIETRLYRRVD